MSRVLNPGLVTFPLSCRTGEGLDAWVDWLLESADSVRTPIMGALSGVRIHITGIVQGVGFRPFVYGLAKHYELNGWVRNTSAGVDIEVDGEQEVLDAFVKALRDEAPPLSRIDELTASFQAANGFRSFEIVHSEAVEGAFQPISPDCQHL